MQFTLSNLTLQNKPTRDGMGKFLGGLKFSTRNIPLTQVKQAIEEGYTLTYLYKDTDFSYKGYNKTKNYRGTNYIIVDVDKCEQSPEDFVKELTYKPTIYHTTFSNLTERNGGKYCFHLIYCLSQTVYGEDNFRQLFNTFTNDYADQVDDQARDCHRIVFTSNKALPNFEYYCSGIVYDPTLFITDEQAATIEHDTAPQATTPAHDTKKQKNTLNLDEDFFADLMTLGRRDFLRKYLPIYPPQRSTAITEDLVRVAQNGVKFADLRGTDYYEVPSKWRYDTEKGKGQVVKVAIGERQRQLFFDIALFMECNPNITKEGLVTAIVNEVWEFYDNSDKELTNTRLIQRCAGLWDNRPTMKATGRKFKILECEDMSKRKASGVVKKLLKDEEIGNSIDLKATLEENIKLIHTSKKRLIQFCLDYDIKLKTDKEVKQERILSVLTEHPQASLRELEKIFKAEGIQVSYRTLQRCMERNCDKT